VKIRRRLGRPLGEVSMQILKRLDTPQTYRAVALEMQLSLPIACINMNRLRRAGLIEFAGQTQGLGSRPATLFRRVRQEQPSALPISPAHLWVKR
jgi:predicted ArsR family transcriptional regulator